MQRLTPWLLGFGLISGQLIKVPINLLSGPTLLDLMILFFNILGLYQTRFKIPGTPLIIKAALIFILIACLSLIMTPLHLSHEEIIISFFYTARFFNFILFGWILYLDIFPIILKETFQILVFSGVIMSILGIFQLYFIDLSFLATEGWDPHHFRTVSTFLDPNFMGAYFSLTLTLLVQKGLMLKDKRLLILSFILVYFALLTTFSRGSYLMLGVAFFCLTFLHKSLKLGLLTVVCLLGLYLGYYFYLHSSEQPRIAMKAASAQTRVSSWQMGWQIFNNSPVFGIGHNAYRYALREYNLVPEAYFKGRGASANDSSLLQILSTTGIIGLSSFIAMLGILGWAAWKTNNPWGKSLIAGTLGLIAHSFFSNSLFYPFLMFWLVLATVKMARR